MDDLDLIKEKINIVDLIQEYFPLKKSGVNYKANCPFHQEKTPSFIVSPERGIFKCFGCSRGGDIFKFLMEKDGLDFSDALEILAKRAGVTLKRKRTDSQNQKERLYEANQKAAQFFNYLLTEHSLGKRALEYLKKRGVSDQTIKEFNLGYAPNSWESLSKFLKKKGFTVKELLDAGLLISSPKGGYDRFRGRIMFPLMDVKNQIVGFAGRILGPGEPKYLNTPQTILFDKSHFLFGLNLAKAEIRSKDQVILVEGLMDMVMSYQAGVKNVVATQGTALTQTQVELIKKYTGNTLLCFDKDVAGDSASRRGIEMLDNAGLNIKVIEVKDGKDPADMVSKDPASWQKAVETAEPIYDYYLRSVSLRHKTSTAEGRKAIAQELLPIWAKISDNLTREDYVQKLAALLRTSEDILRREIKLKGSSPVNFNKILIQNPVSEVGMRSRRELLEEYLLALLLKVPSDSIYVPNFPETLFISETFRSIYVLLVLYLDTISFKGADFSVNEFIKGVPEELLPSVDRLYLMEIDDKLEGPKEWQQEVEKIIVELRRVLVKASLEKLSAEIKNAQIFDKIELLENLNRKFRDLSLKLRSL